MTSVSGGMTVKNASSPVKEQAETWFARLMSPDCSPAECAEFERWRTADTAHASAYAATERLWKRLEGLEGDPQIGAYAAEALRPEPMETSQGLQPPGPAESSSPPAVRLRRGSSHATSEWPLMDTRDCSEAATAMGTGLEEVSSSNRRWFVPAALAASIALAAAGAHFGRQFFNEPPKTTVGTGTYETGRHPLQLALEDGSTVRLDVATRLSVDLTPRDRTLRLDGGRALFDVASDRNRPFTVHAGDGLVVAIGTRFQVDRTNDRIKVVLAEGAVVVTQTAGDGALGKKTTMFPGEELVYSSAGKEWAKHKIDPEPATSWALGYHVFRATPLGEAVQEINRYAQRKIRLADPALAALPVSGSFKTGDSASIATALPSVLPVRVEQQGAEIELFSR